MVVGYHHFRKPPKCNLATIQYISFRNLPGMLLSWDLGRRNFFFWLHNNFLRKLAILVGKPRIFGAQSSDHNNFFGETFPSGAATPTAQADWGFAGLKDGYHDDRGLVFCVLSRNSGYHLSYPELVFCWLYAYMIWEIALGFGVGI